MYLGRHLIHMGARRPSRRTMGSLGQLAQFVSLLLGAPSLGQSVVFVLAAADIGRRWRRCRSADLLTRRLFESSRPLAGQLSSAQLGAAANSRAAGSRSHGDGDKAAGRKALRARRSYILAAHSCLVGVVILSGWRARTQ